MPLHPCRDCFLFLFPSFFFYIYLIFQSINEQLDKMKAELQKELKHASSLQAKVSELEVCVFQASNTVIDDYIISR